MQCHGVCACNPPYTPACCTAVVVVTEGAQTLPRTVLRRSDEMLNSRPLPRHSTARAKLTAVVCHVCWLSLLLPLLPLPPLDPTTAGGGGVLLYASCHSARSTSGAAMGIEVTVAGAGGDGAGP